MALGKNQFRMVCEYYFAHPKMSGSVFPLLHYSITPILLKINYRVPFRGKSKPDTTVPGSLIIVKFEVFEGGKSVVRRLTIATAITCV
jgi:hypothetical protein